MTTQADTFDNGKRTNGGTAPAAIPVTRQLYWSVRRELWENRSIYIAPLAAAGIVLFGFFMVLLRAARHADLTSLDTDHQLKVMLFPYDAAAGLIMATAAIVSVFYCLEALHGERQDRSILFWKSLPVSDLTAVLAKTSVPLLILPLVAFVATVAAQLCILLSCSVVRAGGGTAPSLWAQVSLIPMAGMLLYHLFAVHAIWYAPLYAWLLLVSAWARRAPFLWAFLPPIAVCVLEKIIFNTSHFASMLGTRLSGSDSVTSTTPGMMPMDPGTHITLGKYLSAPGLWIGLLVAAIFLAAAVQLRRSRSSI